MESILSSDTVAAISTAAGEAGIGVIRISGPEARRIALRVFRPGRAKRSGEDGYCGKTGASDAAGISYGVSDAAIGNTSGAFDPAESDPSDIFETAFAFKPRYMHYGHIVDPIDGRVLDEALCVYMKGPRSYTGEDVVEIQCHGSYVSLRDILALVIREGAVPADRGEFTKRAFMNGRLDLAQAEAVMDLISSKSSRGHEVAMSQVMGSLSGRIASIRARLLDELVGISVNMDYPDEDIEQVVLEKLQNSLITIKNEISTILASANEGRIVREGVGIALVGRPNVGKSSLMNRFLRSERSIVTDIPGTTRDTVEESASMRGISVRFVDTAGIRESSDPVEMLGVERSRRALGEADLILLLLDDGTGLEDEDLELLELCRGRSFIAVLNKNDRGSVIDEEELSSFGPAEVVRISALSGEGMDELEHAVERTVLGDGFSGSEPLISNARHIALACRARDELAEAIEQISLRSPLDIIEINVHASFDALGEITGETATDDIIDEVFSRFCLGK